MPSQRYNDEYKIFNERFGLNNFPIKEHYNFKKKMKVFDSFTFNANSKNADRNLYLECLLDTLTDKLESITKFEEGKTYQSESFSLGEFLIGYEGLMQSIHCDELGPGQLPTRKPFEGASFKDIAAAVRIHVRKFDRPTHSLLIDDIRKGKMSIDKLESITGPAIQRLNTMRPTNASGSWQWNRDLAPDFASVHIAMRAMDQIVSRRTFWQRINLFRLRRNAKEERLLNSLKAIHADITNNCQHNDIEDVYRMDNRSIIDGARQKLRDFAEKFKIEDLNPEAKATSAKSAKELFADKQVTNHITNGIVEIASKGNVLSNVNKNSVTASWKSSSMFIVTAAADLINDMWKRFEKTNDPAEKEKIIEKGAIDVFKNVRTRMGFFRLEDKSTFIAAQRVTDLLLKTYSPIATDETYAKYANNYFITNKGPAETTGRNLKVAPENHLENLKEQLPLWNEIRAELGIDGPAPLPSVEEIKKADEILIEEKHKAEEEKARKDAEDKAAAEETAAKKKEFIEKNKAKEGQANAPTVDDKKEKISIPALSENINKTETSPKVKENEVPTTQNVKNP